MFFLQVRATDTPTCDDAAAPPPRVVQCDLPEYSGSLSPSQPGGLCLFEIIIIMIIKKKKQVYTYMTDMHILYI